MNPEVLAGELEQQPFVPLRLHLSDGDNVEVHDPDVAVIARLALYLFKVRREGSTIADDSRIISLRHIVSVEQLEQAGRA